jgi:two-component system CheB/CheR fusion protein
MTSGEAQEPDLPLRRMLDSTAQAVYTVDAHGFCTFANQACARLLDIPSPDALIGEPVDIVFPHCRDADTPAAVEQHPAHVALARGEPVHGDQDEIRRQDGSCVAIEYWADPIVEGGRTVGAVVTLMDISRRRRAEAAARSIVGRRQEFLAMLSHELRNPLAAILDASELMRAFPGDAWSVERARGVVGRQSRHLARLLDELLDAARILRGELGLRMGDVDVRECVRLAIESAGAPLTEREIALSIEMPDTMLPVRGDAARLQQAIADLLTNAARYSTPGGPVEVEAVEDGGDIVVRVRDSGRGIPRERLNAIFDLFVQDDRGLDRQGGGLGVGLALVRKIAALHGGSVLASSDGLGLGSEFVLRLPRHPYPPHGEPADVAPGAASRRVVLVEDHDDSREMLRMLLEVGGHVVLEAADGVEAMPLIVEQHPDIALIDVGLPRMTGLELARALRANPRVDDVLLVALTGYGTPADVQASAAAGFDAHMTKPIDFEQLSALIARGRRGTQLSR